MQNELGFEASRLIHEGDHCRVYRAVRRDGEPVVLKVLEAEPPSPEGIARFRREYELTSKLDAPSIVRVRGFEEQGGRYAIVLEDFGGESLDRLAQSRHFELAEKLAIAIAATEALGALHERGVVHNDVSPANFVYNPKTGVLKIIDLGAATTLGHAPQKERTCSMLDFRSDLDALGETLYDLFTGDPPFSPDDATERVFCPFTRKPGDPRPKYPTIPEALSGVLMRLLATTPNAHQSTSSIKADLVRCQRELFENGTLVRFPNAPPGSSPTSPSRDVHGAQISLENAQRHHEMEQQLAERTEELRKKNIELQEALDRLRTTQAQLVQSEKMASLGRLTVGIVHEIKNPLNFVNNFAQTNVDLVAELEETLASTPKTALSEVADVLADLRTSSDKIVEHGKRADGIVRSMMQHASGASGVPHEVDLNALVEDYVKLSYHGSRADAQPFELRIERDYDDTVGRVSVVSQDLGRVLVNLFSNALYSVGEKKRKSATGYVPTLHVSTRREGKSVKIEIRDNGLGIAAKVQSRIFEPFFTTKPGNAGTGLGLSLSHEIVVKGHGGKIGFESVEGDHATFVLTLPA